MLDHFLVPLVLLRHQLVTNARAHPAITTLGNLDHRPQVLHLASVHQGRPRHAGPRHKRPEPPLRRLLDPAKCSTTRAAQNQPLQEYRAELDAAGTTVQAAASLDEMTAEARSAMLGAARRHLTQSALALSARKPYISEETRRAQKKRWRRYDEAARRTGSQVPDRRSAWDPWRQQCETVTRLVRRDRRAYVRRLAAEMEDAAKRKEVHQLFKLVRELARMGKRRPANLMKIRLADGSLAAGDKAAAGRIRRVPHRRSQQPTRHGQRHPPGGHPPGATPADAG